MNEQPVRIFLCTNGSEETRPALEYGAWLAGVLESPVVLLGVVEAPDERIEVETRLAEAERMLKDHSVAYEVKLDTGRGSETHRGSNREWWHRGPGRRTIGHNSYHSTP